MTTKNETYFLAIPLKGWMMAVIVGVTAVIVYDTVGTNNNDNDYAPICHDWECNYIIRDGYTNGEEVTHYIDSYVKNDDNSISFISDDGLVTEIPYPYYEVIKNPNM